MDEPLYIVESVNLLHVSITSTSHWDSEDRLGSGTRIFTKALLKHPTWNKRIKWLRAVEPSEGMRETFSKTVNDDRVSLSEGYFDATGVEDGWADLVVIAQVSYFFLSVTRQRLNFEIQIGFPLVPRLR